MKILLPFALFALTATALATTTTPIQQMKTMPSNPMPSKLGKIQPPPPNIDIQAPAWVLMAYPSGQVLAGRNIHQEYPPASLAKLMTSYVISNAVEHGSLKLQEPILISNKAWKATGSKMFIKAGEKISVENLMKGMIVSSGNDATIALAEHIAGSEQSFVSLMNSSAKALGMHNSYFQNTNGLPADHQYTSAYDMALLSRALISHFPKEYAWYKLKSFSWNGITQKNRNRLLFTDKSVDGLKTGYTQKAKYSLVGSAKRDHMRLIAVILGAKNPSIRAEEMRKLLHYGFRFFENHTLFVKGQTIQSVPITSGAQNQVPLTVHHNINLTLPHGQYPNLKVSIHTPEDLKAPLAKNTQVGYLSVALNGKQLLKEAVYTQKAIAKGSLWQRLVQFAESVG